ncbi:hypothetical protein ACFOD7_10910 [Paracoccus fontiphilus]|uniref:Biopolymer transporter ExbB n=2 Tax=Paracoccus fontiphilus TaxID=1815556 RepID=A0ABV7IHB4_9RHOB
MSDTSQQPDPSAHPRLGAANRRISATRTQGPGPASPHFSQPVRQVVMMITVLALVLAGGWITYGRILPIFRANLWLNGLILGVFALGVLACFWQVAQLTQSVSWIERFAKRRGNAVEKGIAARGGLDTSDQPPRLLAPLAALLGTRGPAGGVISTGAAASILDSVATRIDELRDITRYLANLLIFLGLLGTFYGLATTIPAVVETIRTLAPQQGESGIQVFDKLMSGLESQLGGMATAFSSSLLGLAGSLVVGLLELFATHGQNRFYRELEEWMSGFTRVSLAGSEGDAVDQAALAGFLEQMAGQMDRLQQIQAERDAQRDDAAAMADERVVVMAQAIEALVQRSEAEQEASLSRVASLTEALSRLAEGQDQLVDLTRLQAERPAAPPPDLAGIESALNRLTADLTDGREEMVAELRSDILVLTRAVRAARFNDPFRDDLLRDPLVSRDGG